jgi:transcriptional regulator GlxA family with amidase domain
VPIQFDGRLIGVAKLVVGSETSDRTFSTATSVLDLLVTRVCQESVVAGLSQEVGVLRQRVADLRQMRSKGDRVAGGAGPPAAGSALEAEQRRNLTLVDNALAYLHRHYREPALSLASVAEALECNPRYLTARFTLIAGQHMHAYLVGLRVAHACRLVMETALPVKEVAYESGFRGNAGLDRAFRRHVGVPPGEYRRIFAAR